MADRTTIEPPAVKWGIHIALALGLLGAAWWFPRNTASSPEHVIQRWFEAAERGDMTAVLALCAEPLRSQLAMGSRQEGAPLSTAALQASMRGVKGLGIQKLDLQGDQGFFLVELVHADRNERHRMELIRERGQWRIARIESDTPVVPPVRYGTPAFEE